MKFNPRATKSDFFMLFVGLVAMVVFAAVSFVFFAMGKPEEGFSMLVPALACAFVSGRGLNYMVVKR